MNIPFGWLSSAFAFMMCMIFSSACLSASFDEILSWYGFTTSEQHKALTDILHYAEIIPQNQTLLDVFGVHGSPEDVLAVWISLVTATQEKLFQRAHGQERWQVSASSWMQEHHDKLYSALDTLGFIDEQKVGTDATDAICVLGSTYKSLGGRIAHARELVRNQHDLTAVILLAGERMVSERTDGSADELDQIAQNRDVSDWHQLTETDLICYLWDASAHDLRDVVPVYVIDTPKRNLPRPTTQTTIEELIMWLHDHPEITHITFVSTQPHVLYQKAVIAGCMAAHRCSVDYQVVGNKRQKTAEIQMLVESFAAYLWASLPVLLATLDTFVVDEHLYNVLDSLYSRNPLLHELVHAHVAINRRTTKSMAYAY